MFLELLLSLVFLSAYILFVPFEFVMLGYIIQFFYHDPV